MIPVVAAVAAALMVGVVPSSPGAAAEVAEPENPPAWTQPAASTSADPQAIVEQSGDSGPMTVVSAVQDGAVLRIETEPVASTAQAVTAIAEAQDNPDLVAVDVDSVHRLTGLPDESRARASDPSRTRQWALDTLGAEDAWPSSTGAGVTVAVIDSGVARHPDLAGAFVDGIDVVDGTDPRSDVIGHGTHVAGIIAMTADNNIGGAGLAPGVSLMPVVVADADGSVRASDSARGIIWAVDHGADVLNMSYAGSATSVERKAIQYAQAKGAVTVAAVGNEYADDSGGIYNPIEYPAAFPGVVGVGAVTRDLRRASFSEVGKQVDVMAPGAGGPYDSTKGIFSTFRRTDYANLQGTSMATPHASAALALIIARERALGAKVDPIDLLLGTARDLGRTGRDDEYGFGLINPLAALALVDGIANGGVAPDVNTSEVATRSVHKITVEVLPGYLRFRIPAKGRFMVGWQQVRGKGWSTMRRFQGPKKGQTWHRADTAGGLRIRLVAYRTGKTKKNDPVWLSPVLRTRAAQPGVS